MRRIIRCHDLQWKPLGTNSILALMTKHNIREHLSWLLISNSSKPPHLGSIALDTENSFLLSTNQADNFREPLLETGVVDTTESLDNVHSSDRESRSQPQHPLPSQISMITQGREAMARLQSGPKSGNKPKLLSQACADSLQTPKTSQAHDIGTSLRDRYCALYTQNTSGNVLTCRDPRFCC